MRNIALLFFYFYRNNSCIFDLVPKPLVVLDRMKTDEETHRILKHQTTKPLLQKKDWYRILFVFLRL